MPIEAGSASGVHRALQAIHPRPVHSQRPLYLGVSRLLHEADDPPRRVHAHDAERVRGLGPYRSGGDGHLGSARRMPLEQGAEIHPVELVPRQNEHQAVRVVAEVDQVLAHGIGGALVPALALGPLLRREDLDEAAGEAVEAVALLDVAVQRAAVELRQQADAAEVGVEAVADRDVHDPVLPAQRDRGLRPVLGEREEPGAGAAAQDDREDLLWAERAPGASPARPHRPRRRS